MFARWSPNRPPRDRRHAPGAARKTHGRPSLPRRVIRLRRTSSRLNWTAATALATSASGASTYPRISPLWRSRTTRQRRPIRLASSAGLSLEVRRRDGMPAKKCGASSNPRTRFAPARPPPNRASPRLCPDARPRRDFIQRISNDCLTMSGSPWAQTANAQDTHAHAQPRPSRRHNRDEP